jgi:hypothetical protein
LDSAKGSIIQHLLVAIEPRAGAVQNKKKTDRPIGSSTFSAKKGFPKERFLHGVITHVLRSFAEEDWRRLKNQRELVLCRARLDGIVGVRSVYGLFWIALHRARGNVCDAHSTKKARKKERDGMELRVPELSNDTLFGEIEVATTC